MLLSQLSPEAQQFFNGAFDLSKDIQNAICLKSNLKDTYPLHYAVRTGNLFVIEELIDCGVNPNQLDISYVNRDIFGSLTPIMYACHHMHLNKKNEIIDLLLLKGADVNFKNEKNETVLTFSIFMQDVNAFEFFLKKEADPFYDSITTDRLKFHLANLMENKPYQFSRVLKLLSDSKEEGVFYCEFERQFLEMLEQCRHYVLTNRRMVADPRLQSAHAQNPGQARVLGDVSQSEIEEMVPQPPRLFRGAEKLLNDIKNGEDRVKKMRQYLEKKSFVTYLEMTSKWMLAKNKTKVVSVSDDSNSNDYEFLKKKLPLDLEKSLAVDYFGFSYKEINRVPPNSLSGMKRKRKNAEEIGSHFMPSLKN